MYSMRPKPEMVIGLDAQGFQNEVFKGERHLGGFRDLFLATELFWLRAVPMPRGPGLLLNIRREVQPRGFAKCFSWGMRRHREHC